MTYAGEGTVVPEVTLVGEAVTDEAELALLGVLLDGVEELLLGDLNTQSWSAATSASGVSKRIPPAWRWSSGGSQRSC